MPLQLGSSSALFRVGSGSPSKVFLGTVSIQNVPGAPVITAASVSGEFLTVTGDAPSNNGGSSITGYRLYVNGDFYLNQALELVLWDFGGEETPIEGGDEIRISAVNAIGEGPLSNAVTAT